VIPTYNRAVLVLESIRTVTAQSFEDFEIIVVDDGSTDDTGEVIKTIASGKLFYYKKPNGERGAARNFGIGKAKGKYVVFLDSDDRMLKNHLKVLHEHLSLHHEDLIATKYFFFDEKHQKVPKEIKRLSAGYHTHQTFLTGNPLACCFTVRRENPDLFHFREEIKYAIMEDWIFLMENLRRSKLYLIDQVTLGMRDHELRSMKGSARKIIDARKNALSYLLGSGHYSDKEKKILIGNSDYFCAVHSYIGGEIRAGFQYLIGSVARIGLPIKSLFLFSKLCLKIVWVRVKKGS
jgi:glycosyltransferase involved in cell wall biosynthesis